MLSTSQTLINACRVSHTHAYLNMTHPTIVRMRELLFCTLLVCMCVGFGMEAVCLYCLGFITDGVTAIVFLTIGVGSSASTISG